MSPTHFYTASATEWQTALLQDGFMDEGVACYVYLQRGQAPLGHGRLRGAAAARDDQGRAAALVLCYRLQAQRVPAYVRSFERWFATAAR